MGYSKKSQRNAKKIEINKTKNDGFEKKSKDTCRDPRKPLWKLVIIDKDGNGEH
jgi:hypothetical protein